MLIVPLDLLVLRNFHSTRADHFLIIRVRVLDSSCDSCRCAFYSRSLLTYAFYSRSLLTSCDRYQYALSQREPPHALCVLSCASMLTKCVRVCMIPRVMNVTFV
jgi:hypothetical protein